MGILVGEAARSGSEDLGAREMLWETTIWCLQVSRTASCVSVALVRDLAEYLVYATGDTLENRSRAACQSPIHNRLLSGRWFDLELHCAMTKPLYGSRVIPRVVLRKA